MTKRHCTLEHCICKQEPYAQPLYCSHYENDDQSMIVKVTNLLQKLWAKIKEMINGK